MAADPFALERYAIRSLDEAGAYLQHPLLGERLIACAAALLGLEGNDPVAVMGLTDAMKLRSSMTLFAGVPDADQAFRRILERYYNGQPDLVTMDLLTGCQ